VTVKGAAKITIAKSGVFHRAANMSLASVASLDLASGVAMRVASLKIDGAEMPVGDYQFGSGTLSVGPVAMRIIVR
jgi:predicted transcriptional regulator